MDKVISIYEAKTNLSKLVKKAQAGQTIYIGAYGNKQAMLVPLEGTAQKQAPQLGIWASNPNVIVPDDFDTVDPDIVAMFEDSQISSDESA